jgi:hypothetical protein
MKSVLFALLLLSTVACKKEKPAATEEDPPTNEPAPPPPTPQKSDSIITAIQISATKEIKKESDTIGNQIEGIYFEVETFDWFSFSIYNTGQAYPIDYLLQDKLIDEDKGVIKATGSWDSYGEYGPFKISKLTPAFVIPLPGGKKKTLYINSNTKIYFDWPGSWVMGFIISNWVNKKLKNETLRLPIYFY